MNNFFSEDNRGVYVLASNVSEKKLLLVSYHGRNNNGGHGKLGDNKKRQDMKELLEFASKLGDHVKGTHSMPDDNFEVFATAHIHLPYVLIHEFFCFT